MADINEELYNAYFGRTNKAQKVETNIAADRLHRTVLAPDNGRRIPGKETVFGQQYEVKVLRHLADDNIDNIEQLADILKRLCNAAWGNGWGELSPDLKKGENNASLILPQITLDVNVREIDENFGTFKPRLMDIIKETDDNGDLTGDAFLVYRQWFNCNVEFNIYGRTSKEARTVTKRFEDLISVYTGYLKRQGVSEIWFEQETHPKCSLNYDESAFMRSIYYYIRFEAITPIRQTTINRINAEIGVGALNTEKVKSLLEQNSKELVDLDFFDGDNGITFNED